MAAIYTTKLFNDFKHILLQVVVVVPMEFSDVMGSLLIAIVPIAKGLEAIVVVGAALDTTEVSKCGWVGGGKVDTTRPLGHGRSCCKIFGP